MFVSLRNAKKGKLSFPLTSFFQNRSTKSPNLNLLFLKTLIFHILLFKNRNFAVFLKQLLLLLFLKNSNFFFKTAHFLWSITKQEAVF